MQDHPKFTQIGIFWFENIPSGNPGFQETFRGCADIAIAPNPILSSLIAGDQQVEDKEVAFSGVGVRCRMSTYVGT
jgi:hypothetical protein